MRIHSETNLLEKPIKTINNKFVMNKFEIKNNTSNYIINILE
jgi:hypothetical protein